MVGVIRKGRIFFRLFRYTRSSQLVQALTAVQDQSAISGVDGCIMGISEILNSLFIPQ